MKTLTPVSWTEGMFLKPHHFQQADSYQDARLAYHLRALSTDNSLRWRAGRWARFLVRLMQGSVSQLRSGDSLQAKTAPT